MKRAFIIGVVVGVLGLLLLFAAALFAMTVGRPMLAASASALGGDAAPTPPAARPPAPEPAQVAAPRRSLNSFGSNDRAKMKRELAKVDALGLMKGGGGGAAEAKEVAAALEGEKEVAPQTRAWFPETFLFNPLVETDAQGAGSVSVRVPDRLTSWRVLALAHSREGAQAGAVTSFRGTLPVYVDPVVPAFLRAGDRVRLPVAVINTTDKPISLPLRVEAVNAAIAGGGEVRVAAGGQEVKELALSADREGMAVLRFSLGATDAVVRTIPVLPVGRRVEARKAGTLAAPRAFELATPGAGEARARIVVFGGALAVVRSELASALARSGSPEGDAYALQVAAAASKLGLATEEKEALRSLILGATQRMVRHGRAPDSALAATLAEAAAGHPDNPILTRLAERLSLQLAKAQRPDGTFGGGEGWPLQRVLAATADGVRALQATASLDSQAAIRATAAALKASGAFERYLERIQDGYTVASILSSGAVSGTVADRLRAKLREAVKTAEDGSRYVEIPDGVLRPDGTRATSGDATALAVVALEGDAEAKWRPDLAASVLGKFQAGRGWSDSRSDLAAMRAVLSAFREPLPKSVTVKVLVDGAPVATGVLEPQKEKGALVLEPTAAIAKGSHRWELVAEPALPGLGYSLTLQGSAPWEKEPAREGLELEVKAPAELRRGVPAEVRVEAGAPAGMSLRVEASLPAGVQPERSDLDRWVSEGALRSYKVEDGAVVLHASPLQPGKTLNVAFRVVATLSGTIRGGASSLAPEDSPEAAHRVPPAAWTVR